MIPAVDPAAKPKRVLILGSPVDILTMVDCLAKIEEFIEGPSSHLVVTADSSSLVRAQTDAKLQDVYGRASLITPDSAGVLWAAKRYGASIPARVSGVEILDQVCRISAEKGWKLGFLGAEPGVAALAAENFRGKYPGCQIVGTRDGYFSREKDEEVARELQGWGADVLFVAMGIPRQEIFVLDTMHIIQAKVGIGVGGSFDVFSGKVKRAPRLFQRLHLEWLWRVLSDPSKISKIKLLPVFVKDVLKHTR